MLLFLVELSWASIVWLNILGFYCWLILVVVVLLVELGCGNSIMVLLLVELSWGSTV